MRNLMILIFLTTGISAYCQTPTKEASNIVFTFIGCNEVNIQWTNGNGSDRVVFMREGSSSSNVPDYNQYYTDNSIFGLGEVLSTDKNKYCVFRGPGNSVTVKGLKNLTTYYVDVFEYNGGGGIYDYKTDAFPKNNFTTKNIVADFKVSDSKTNTKNELCLHGNSFDFTNSSSSDLSPLTYTWDFADGNSSTLTNPVHSYKTEGLKAVKLTAMSPGCYATATRNAIVHPHPVAKFDLDPALLPKNSDIQCFFGNRFTFRNKSTLVDIGVGLSSMRYEWYDTTETTAFATAYKADRHFPSDGLKKIKLIVISNKDCIDSTYMYYTVKPRAIDTTKVLLDPKSMCLANNLFTFKNNSPNSISSRWFLRDSSKIKDLDTIYIDTLYSNPDTKSFNKTGKFYITLRAYDNGGCLDQWTSSVNVIENSIVNFKGLNKEYCLNTGMSPLAATPYAKYGKFQSDGTIKNDSVFYPDKLGKIYITFTSSLGCKESYKDSTIVHPLPIIDLGEDISICNDIPFQLNIDPALGVYWTSVPATTGVNGSTSNSININQTGTYLVRVTDKNKCENTDKINIKVLKKPELTPQNDLTLCGGEYLKFDLKAEEGTIIWDDGSMDAKRIISRSGYYKVTLKNKCGEISNGFNLTVEETACIVFFPNAFSPNGDLLNDTWQPYGKYEFIQMNIFNRWGEQVYFSDKSPVWNGYSDKNLCIDGVYNCVFQYYRHEGNTMKREVEGLNIHLIK